MTFRHLKIFRQVCTDGSITKAAASLGMSQPSVSVAIGELETFYDTKLFDRISRRLFLTPAGQQLMEYAVSILDTFSESVKTIQGKNTRTSLKVGLCSNFAAAFFSLITKEYRRQFPHIHLISYAYASSTVLDLLNRNEVELAVINHTPPANVDARPIWKDDYVLLCTREFADRLHKPLTAKGLDGVDMVLPSTPGSLHRPLYDWLSNTNTKPNYILFSASVHTMETATLSGLVALPILRRLAMDRMEHDSRYVMVEFSGERPELTFSLCSLKGKHIDEAMQGYTDILMRLCR